MNKAKQQLLATVIFATLLAAGTTAGAVDAGLSEATKSICANLKSVEKSTFLGVIAIIMVVAGVFMIWFKARGGIAMLAFGVVGFFVVRNVTTLASNLGLKACG